MRSSKETDLAVSYKICVSFMFFVQGWITASWAARIVSIQQQLHLNAAQLGIILLFPTLGAILGFPLFRLLSSKYDIKNILCLCGGLCSLILIPIALAPNMYILSLYLIVLGICGNVFSIANNTQGALLEKLYDKPIFSSLHAYFSIGGILGATLSGVLIGLSVSTITHFAVLSVCVIVACIAVFPYLISKRNEDVRSPAWELPDKGILLLGLAVCCSFLSEGAIADWSAVYFNEVVKNHSLVTAGYVSFSVSMAIGRLNGDWLKRYLGIFKMVNLCCFCALTGTLIAVAFIDPVFLILGFGLMGLGFSAIVPISYSEAGKSIKMSESKAVTTLTSIGFVGFLIGPTIIGVTANYITVRYALLIIALMILMISVFMKLYSFTQKQ